MGTPPQTKKCSVPDCPCPLNALTVDVVTGSGVLRTEACPCHLLRIWVGLIEADERARDRMLEALPGGNA
jgi:hypothetical protein